MERRKDCAKQFGISTTTLDRWVKELGLTYKHRAPSKPSKNSSEIPSKVEVKQVVEVQKGYCLDCEHYVVGGLCDKTNKITGALHEKPCFKPNTL